MLLLSEMLQPLAVNEEIICLVNAEVNFYHI